jgi:AAA domain-containing protein
MQNFRFESISLLSQKEMRARKITFSPFRNLIVGRNHTGKSSLIKSLFLAFGAKPEGELDRWDNDAVSLVEFSINSDRYCVVQQLSYRALFSSSGALLFSARTIADWNEKFTEVTGFNLVLTDKNQETVAADARAFFLPFYINQDGSWHSTWSTFTYLQQYKNPIAPILEYFTGVKPPEYYEISSRRSVTQKHLNGLQQEMRLIGQVRERFGKAMPLTGPKTVPAIFDKDISLLTDEITLLNSQQEELRDLHVREQEVLESLRLQVKMAQETLQTYESDASFLRDEPHDTLVCPTCGAEHQKSFMDMLNFAEDARVLRQLMAKLQSDAQKAAEAHGKTRERLRELDQRYQRVSQILETRRGDLKFDDVVKSMGAEVAFEAFADEIGALKAQIDKSLGEIESLEAKLSELTSRERSNEILKLFRDSYAQARHALNLPPIETKSLRLTSRPDVSGSGGPRSILAYYSALWTASLGRHGSFSVPLVIDSPQQQGQDEVNLPKMIEYVSGNLPKNAQVLLGIESPTDKKFDRIIELDVPYQLLLEEHYEAVNAVVEPYLKQMYKELLGAP